MSVLGPRALVVMILTLLWPLMVIGSAVAISAGSHRAPLIVSVVLLLGVVAVAILGFRARAWMAAAGIAVAFLASVWILSTGSEPSVGSSIPEKSHVASAPHSQAVRSTLTEALDQVIHNERREIRRTGSFSSAAAQINGRLAHQVRIVSVDVERSPGVLDDQVSIHVHSRIVPEVSYGVTMNGEGQVRGHPCNGSEAYGCVKGTWSEKNHRVSDQALEG